MKIFYFIFLKGLLIFMCLSTTIYAQTPKITTSETLNDSKGFTKSVKEYITTIDGNHYFSAYDYGFRAYHHIKRFDGSFNLNLDQRTEVILQHQDIMHLFGLGKEIFLMTDHGVSKEDKHSYHLTAFDKDAKQLGDIALAEVAVTSKRYKQIPHLKFSKDSSLIVLVSHAKDHDSKKVDFEVHVNIVDRKLNKVDSYSRILPYDQSEFDYLNSWVDSKGEAYVFGKVTKMKEGDKYVVLSIKDKKAPPLAVKIGDEVALSYAMSSTSGLNFVVGGFVSESKTNIATGYFMTEIDPVNKKVVKSIYNKFSDADIEILKNGDMHRNRGNLKGVNAEFPTSKLLHSCLNGQYLLTIESFYHMEDKRSRDYYTHGTFCILFDPELNASKKFVIPRNLKILDFDVSSLAFCDEKGVYFLFNDNADNADVYDASKIKRMTAYSKSTPVVFTYNLQGNMKKYPLTILNYKLDILSLRKVGHKQFGFILYDFNYTTNNQVRKLGFVELE